MAEAAKVKRSLTISNKQNNLFTHIHVVASNRPALLGGILNELITWQLGIVKAMFVVSPSHYWCSMLVEDSVQGGKVMSQLVPGMIAALRTTTSRKGELPEDMCTSMATASPSTATLKTCVVDFMGSAGALGFSCGVIRVAIAGTVESTLLRELVLFLSIEKRLTLLGGKMEFNGTGTVAAAICIQEVLTSEQCRGLQAELHTRMCSLEASFQPKDGSVPEVLAKEVRDSWFELLTSITINKMLELETLGVPENGATSLLEADLARTGSSGSLKAAGMMPVGMMTTYPQSKNETFPRSNSSSNLKPQGIKQSSSFTLLQKLTQAHSSPTQRSPTGSPRNGALKASPPGAPPSAQLSALKLGSPGSASTTSAADQGSRIFHADHAWHKAPWVTDPNRKLTIADFNLHCKLGSGMTSKVYLAKLVGANMFAPGMDDRVVLKVMPKTQVVDMGHRVGELVVAERAVMEMVQGSRHILCLFGHFQDDWALFMVTELAVCDFFHLMTHHFGTRNYWRSAKIYAAQILLGIEHMHERGLLYRDLKPENMLVKEDGSLLIADFGMSIKIKGSQRAHSICGTAEYMCPEMVTQKGYTFIGELWAYGIFLYELLTGTTPFEKQSEDEESSAVLKKIRNHTSIMFPPGSKVDADAKELIRALLQRDETQRLGHKDRVGYYTSIRGAAWFRELNWKDVESGKVKPLINVSQPFPKNVDIKKGQPMPWEHGHQVNYTSAKMFETF